MKTFIKKYYKFIVFFVALFIPFIYSFFYLKAYWDPYGKIDNLNVAIVNLDKKKVDSHSEEFIDSLMDSDSCKFTVENESNATKGLINGKYYAVITLPEDFSKNFENIKNKDRVQTTITYSANHKSNFLASQILNSVIREAESSINTNIDSEIVKSLTSSLNEMPRSLNSITDATSMLKDGTSKLTIGANTLKSGTNSLTSGAASLKNGLNNAYTGGEKLTNGTKDLKEGLNKIKGGSTSLKEGASGLYNGINEVDSGLGELQNNYSLFNNGVNDLNSAITSLDDGVYKLQAGSESLKAGITSYTTNTKNLTTLISYCEIGRNENGEMILETTYNQMLKNNYGIDCNNIKILSNALSNESSINSLNNGATSLDNGLKSLKNGSTSLKEGVDKLSENSGKINTGLNTLKEGTTKLVNGTKTLFDGVNSLDIALEKTNNGANTIYQSTNLLTGGLFELNNGASSLYIGSSKINSGVNALSTGLNSIDKGLNDFNNEVKTNKKNLEKELTNLDGIDSYAKNPAKIKKKPYAEIKTYGKSFVPLFISIGLWVGAIISYLVFFYDRDKKFGILDLEKASINQDIIYLCVSLLYGFITAFLVKNLLGFTVTNNVLYYVSIMFISSVFMSIVQFFIRSFGDLGKFLALVTLILQLTSSGGTFPIETVNRGFSIFNKFLPMTYSIKLIKEVTVKLNDNFALNNILALSLFMLIAFTLNVLITLRKREKCSKIY